MFASRERFSTQESDDNADADAPEGVFNTPSRVHNRVTEVDSGHLESRYGRKKRRAFDKRFVWVVSALLAAGVVWFVVAGGFSFAQNDINARDIGHSIDSSREVSLTFELNVRPGTPAACAIEAVTGSHAPVGYKVIEIPASDSRTRTFTTELLTVGEATTVSVRDCWMVTEPN